MDPNANLADFWKAYDDNRWDEAYELAEDLCVWLKDGGHEPDWHPRGWDAWCVAHGHCEEYVETYMG